MLLRQSRLALFSIVILLSASLCVSAPPLSAAQMPTAQIPPVSLQNESGSEIVTPEFVRSACLYRIDPTANVECGFLLTREVHSDPHSRIIRLHVVIIKSTSEQPATDPLILLNGGPGSAGATMVSSMFNDYIGDAWRSQRDVIYIDQRGTNYSFPSLQCDETLVTPAEISQLSYCQQTAIEARRLQTCYASLLDQGVNLSAYNLQESAADINDLRLALALEQVNIYGYSYGSLLAMTVMRDYPTGIRSVILDSVLPIGVDLRQEKLPALQSGLDALFDACQMDADCRTTYPELARHFLATVERLRTTPAEFALAELGGSGSIQIDDLKFLNHVVSQLQQGRIQYLPAQIESAFVGDYSAVAQTWQTYASSQSASRYQGDNCAAGLYFSTICGYLQSDFSLDLFAGGLDAEIGPSSEVQSIDPSLQEIADHTYSACEFWDVAPTRPDFSIQMKESEIPTLLLSGAFDPSLAPYLVQSVLPQFANGYWYELPVGHGVIFSPCGLRLTYEFLADPTQAPESACVGAMEIDWALRKIQ